MSYIYSDGTEQTREDYSFITGSGDVTLGNLSGIRDNWYAVYGNVSLTRLEFYDATANLILMDGATLTINSTTAGIIAPWEGDTLNIYRQAGGSGTLAITSSGSCLTTQVAVNIYGGNVNLTSTANTAVKSADITVSGGNVNASGASYGLYSTNDIILCWTSSSDRITANSYIADGGSIILNKPFIDEYGVIHTADNVGMMADKTLAPVIVLADDLDNSTVITDANGMTLPALLSDRTLYNDGDWNTLCLPFAVRALTGTPLYGLKLMELDTETGKYAHDTGFSDGTLYLNFKNAFRIEAGKPYIIKKDGPVCTPTGGTSNMVASNSYDKLMDGDNRSMWWARMEDGLVYCEIQSDYPSRFTSYALTTRGYVYMGNNTNPTAWTLKAKLNEGDAWTVIDSRNSDVNSEDALFSDLYTPKEFTIQHPGDYQYYRLEVTGVAGGNVIELLEMTMQGRCVGHITSPCFSGVTIDVTAPSAVSSEDGKVSFVGTYSPFEITDGNIDEIIYLGSGNTIGYASAPKTLRACRAHFVVPTSAGNQAITRAVMNFGGEEGTLTWIVTPYDTDSTYADDVWYLLDGRKLDGEPTQNGMYFNGGRKIMIK